MKTAIFVISLLVFGEAFAQVSRNPPLKDSNSPPDKIGIECSGKLVGKGLKIEGTGTLKKNQGELVPVRLTLAVTLIEANGQERKLNIKAVGDLYRNPNGLRTVNVSLDDVITGLDRLSITNGSYGTIIPSGVRTYQIKANNRQQLVYDATHCEMDYVN